MKRGILFPNKGGKGVEVPKQAGGAFAAALAPSQHVSVEPDSSRVPIPTP